MQAPSETPEDRVRGIIAGLDLLDRTYFGRDRVKKIQEQIEASVAILDSKPIDMVQNKKEKAELLYLRGRTLNYLPEYSRQSEDFLSKSLKLLPTKRDAWDALGHVY